jgi:hypothetical protein
VESVPKSRAATLFHTTYQQSSPHDPGRAESLFLQYRAEWSRAASSGMTDAQLRRWCEIVVAAEVQS